MRLPSKSAVLAGVACGLIALALSERTMSAAPVGQQPDGRSPETGKSGGKPDGTIRILADDTAVPARPVNRDLYIEAVELVQKLHRSADRLASRAKKPEEIRSASSAIKNELIEDYKMLHRLSQIGDELWLSGELDGSSIQQHQVQVVQPPLDAVRVELRPNLGSPEGMVKAVERRAKEQVTQLKQLDEAIKNKRWLLAVKRQTELIHSANEVALFVEPEVAGQVYAPILERAAKIAPEYLLDLKSQQIVPKLREEYATVRPDLAGLSRKIKGVVTGVGERKEIRWDDRVVTGPQCLLQLSAEWQQMDRQVARALSVLHSIGDTAKPDLNDLSAAYTSARTEAITLVSELIQAEASAVSDSDVEARYMDYLAAIPPLMSNLRGSSAEFGGMHTALNQLVLRSPELANKVERYRGATAECLRWRRRLSQRQFQSLRTMYTEAQSMNELLDQPPPMPAKDEKGTGPRVSQTYLLPRQVAQDLGAAWSQQWRGVPMLAANPHVLWPSGAEPIGIAPWRGRVYAEVAMSRQELTGPIQALWRDLAVGPNNAPLTLEAALALHTATYGPFVEIGGVIAGADVQSLPDRLWDWNQPIDVSGSLQPDTLVGPAQFPVLVRLHVAPSWLVHEYFVWVAPPSDSGDSTQADGRASDVSPNKPEDVSPSKRPPPTENAPTKPQSGSSPPPGGKSF